MLIEHVRPTMGKSERGRLMAREDRYKPKAHLIPVGNRIKEARKAMGMSQQAFLNHLALMGEDIKQSQLSNWELGIFEPPIPALRVLARALRVKTDYLLGLEETEWMDPTAAAFYNELAPDQQAAAKLVMGAMVKANDATKTTHGPKAD